MADELRAEAVKAISARLAAVNQSLLGCAQAADLMTEFTLLKSAELRELLGRLAPHEPISQDEQGGCVWCGDAPGAYMYADRKPKNHYVDCPWVAARRLLGDGLDE